MTFAIGLIGALVLVIGSALPDPHVKHPIYSAKDWCFALGGFLMFAYALLNWLAGGPIFFVLLQLLVVLASIFMMLNVSDRVDTPIVVGAGFLLVLWSLWLFEGYETIYFILGLVGIGMGYVLETGSFRREVALTLGSILIALFSYRSGDWIFFWLNTFFAAFSGYYLWRLHPHLMLVLVRIDSHRRVHLGRRRHIFLIKI